MLSPNLVAKGVTFAAADAAGRCFYWSRCPLAFIYDSSRYFEIIFAVSTGNVAKDTYLIAWSGVMFLGSIGYNDNKYLSLDGMLGDMLWGAKALLV